jgi:hypothetical protein
LEIWQLKNSKSTKFSPICAILANFGQKSTVLQGYLISYGVKGV